MIDDDESEEKQPSTRRVITINSAVLPLPLPLPVPVPDPLPQSLTLGLPAGCRVEGIFPTRDTQTGQASADAWFAGAILSTIPASAEMPNGGYRVRYDDGEEVPSLREYLRREKPPQSVLTAATGARGAGGAGGHGGNSDDIIKALKAENLRLLKEASESKTASDHLVSKHAKQMREFKRLSKSNTRLEDDFTKIANEKAQADRDAEGAAQSSIDIDDEGYMGRVAALEVHIALLRDHHKVKGSNRGKPMNITRGMVVQGLHRGLGKTPGPFLKATNGTGKREYIRGRSAFYSTLSVSI